MDQVSQENYDMLCATLRRIKRKADSMVLDARLYGPAWHAAQEFQRLADIALRCLDPDPTA